MKKILFWIFLILSCALVNAQDFQDNFDDLSFPNNPDWFGNTDIYEVNAATELQLMDTAAGESFVYVSAPTADSTTWEFFFRLEFDPSSTNFLSVYLQSDSPDLNEDLNGYYLQIGLSGSEDSLVLRRQDGNSFETLIAGVQGGVAIAPEVRVRVTRDNNANWELFADYAGGTNFQSEGSINDNTYSSGDYFGFKCKYGVTRKDLFYFDDVNIGPLVQDETPPNLLNTIAIDANTVSLQFDEPLDQNSAELITNYSLDNGVTVNAANLNLDPSIVNLSVSTLSSGTDYTLSVGAIEDLSGNAILNDQGMFTYFMIEAAAPFDILINELFPNPDTEITALPDAEFMELYNQSDKAIDLEGYEIFDASNTKVLPSYIFPPQSYLIICDDDDVNEFTSFGNVIGVSGLFALNDSGDDAGLNDNNGVEIHKVSFTTQTYQDADKDEGGWTLELVNPNLYCQGEQNWRASNDPIGGTPGQENSVFNNMPDTESPLLLDMIAISENQLRIFFNETMSSISADVSIYSIANAGTVIDATLEENLQSVLLTIEAPFFVDQESYTLSISDQLSDCSGVSIVPLDFAFGFFLAQPADRYDILINEFYPDFSPSFGLPESEYVELYNRSNKTINLEGFEMINGTTNIILPFYLLQPDSYVTLYEVGVTGFEVLGDILPLPDFFGLGNEGDEFELRDPFGQVIHSVDYDKSWYQNNDKQDGGWSIELINPENPCTFQSNWRASENPVGGTPGQQNSVFDLTPDETALDLIRAFPNGQNAVSLFFNKALDENTIADFANFEVDGLTILDAELLAPFNVLLLQFVEDLELGQIYEVRVNSNLKDCINNGVGNFNTAKFGLPETIEIGEIIINEVLYDPQTGGDRFVELVNRSNKIFNLGDLNLGDRDDDGLSVDTNIEIETDYLLFPGDYVVLTSSPQNIMELYTVENPSALIQSSLPSFDNVEDAVVIFTPELLGPMVIDELKYTRDFHNALLDNEEGVSLERININGATQDPSNWQSAAETAGFATPTYLNSQYFENEGPTENIFEIPNNTVSPDGDGFEDFLLINYNASQGGWVANIQIFDATGRLVKRLIQNKTLANNGTFKWEGDTDNGNKARIGIYILWIEIFKADGEVQQIKKPVVVAGQF